MNAKNSKSSTSEATEQNFKREVEQARTLLTESNKNDLATRHKLGRIVVGLKKDAARYGSRAVERLADELGQDKSTLYKIAKVAGVFEEAEITTLSARASARGVPLSWNHLVLCAPFEKTARDMLVEASLKESLSVQGLAARTKELRPKSKGGPTSPSDDLQRLVKAFENTLKIAHRVIEAPPLRGDDSINPDLKQLLTDAIAYGAKLPDVWIKLTEMLRALDAVAPSAPSGVAKRSLRSAAPTSLTGVTPKVRSEENRKSVATSPTNA
jgi:hypothetical protein